MQAVKSFKSELLQNVAVTFQMETATGSDLALVLTFLTVGVVLTLIVKEAAVTFAWWVYSLIFFLIYFDDTATREKR